VAISPPALWRSDAPPHVRLVFASLRFMATHCAGLVKASMRLPLTREWLLAVPMSAGSRRMPARDAMGTVDDLARSTAFEETFEQTRTPFCGRDITGPVTVVYGDRDWILPRRWRCRDRLPAHARWIEQPGWGHVPMWVDPQGVARTIATASTEMSPSR
jgi:pimeloyl-ACP methyl ester carboxylesterase